MKADFLDAHERHWRDAESLSQAQRWANADHLYGMAAECGLKRLMLAFGMHVVEATGSPNKKEDRVHANEAWLRYESFRKGIVQGPQYALPATNPFEDWDVSQRYACQTNFDQVRVHGHQQGAQTVRDLIRKAKIEGLLP